MWECPSTPHDQRPPTLECEKRLAVRYVPKRPSNRKRTRILPDHRTVEDIRTQHREGERPLVATDGGSSGHSFDDRVAAWGMATRQTSIGGQVHGSDQSAAASEIFGMLQALSAIAEAGTPATLIIDNMFVVRTLNRIIAGGKLPRHASGAWAFARSLLRQIEDLEVYWIPSHGKHEEWAPPDGYDATEWRQLNGIADDRATDIVDARKHNLEDIRRSRFDAQLWSGMALKRQADGVKELRSRYPSKRDIKNIERDRAFAAAWEDTGGLDEVVVEAQPRQGFGQHILRRDQLRFARRETARKRKHIAPPVQRKRCGLDADGEHRARKLRRYCTAEAPGNMIARPYRKRHIVTFEDSDGRTRSNRPKLE